MPMKSQAQRGFLHANKPHLADKFEKKTPKGKKLPKYKGKKGKGKKVPKFKGKMPMKGQMPAGMMGMM